MTRPDHLGLIDALMCAALIVMCIVAFRDAFIFWSTVLEHQR